jgi:NADH-quinone oxidoreductase subunit H
MLLIFSIFSIYPIAVLVAGWASNNKYSLLGGFRSAAQLISYEIPQVLAVLGVIILVNWNLPPNNRTFSFIAISNFQIDNFWLFLLLPIGMVVFFTATLGETERIPFDIPEAESELVMGWRTEYAAGSFLLIMAIEYFHAFVNAGILIILFFGGWNMPAGFDFFDPAIWFFFKLHIVIGVMIWIRAALPRVRIDQFLFIGWTRLIPMAIINLFWAIIVGFLLFNEDYLLEPIIVVIGIVVIIGILLIAGLLTTDKKTKTKTTN